MSEKNFGYLGTSFQQGLLKTIIEDKKFAVTIIDVVDSKYFDGPYFRYLMENIKELYNLYGVVPNYDTIHQKIMKENSGTSSRIHIDTLKLIQDLEISNSGWIKDTSLNFCRQQVLKRSLREVEGIMNNGEFEQYNKIEGIIQEALQVGVETDDVRDVCENVLDALQPDSRVPFPTGISGLDNLMKGGLAKGELGIVLAPTGVGKAQPISEKILTPDGWKLIGDIRAGDFVMGSDGNPQMVNGVFLQGKRPIYRVDFSDGTTARCDAEHLWSVNTFDTRSRGLSKTFETVKTIDMVGNLFVDGNHNYRLPIVNGVKFTRKEVTCNPYNFGKMLDDVEDLIIPDEYRFTDKESRIELLDGILCKFGRFTENGLSEITCHSKSLVEYIRDIVLSLGGSVNIREVGTSEYIRFEVVYGEPLDGKYISNIEYVGVEEAVCIKVSNRDELYITNDYVLTHNTTILTKFANSAYNTGANVLQIFFEDNINDILRKHYTIWSGYRPDEQPEHKEEIVDVIKEVGNRKNSLKLLKLPSFGVSVSDIKSRLRKLEFEGFKTDLLIIDYVDCISSERKIEGEEWKGEGVIMRSLEAMTDEFEIALWTATQGSRDSISSEVVTTDQMGGSIKKAQIGHIVVSVGKTLEQKEYNLATLTLLKSRIGKDGIIFQNCMFDNEYLQIDTDTQNTLLGHQEEQSEKKQQRAAEVFRKSLETKNRIKREVKDKENPIREKDDVEKKEEIPDPLVTMGHQLSDFDSAKARAIEAYRKSKKTEKLGKRVPETVNKLNN